MKDKTTTQYRLYKVGLVLVLVAIFLIALCVGRYVISIPNVIKILFSKTVFSQVLSIDKTWEDMAESVIFTLRLPRVLGAMFIGAALSVSGAAYQGVFKNPLVSPDLLGVSSGACVGAAVAILLGLNSFGVQVLAFVMGVATVLLTVTIPKMLKNTSMTMLVLSGVIVSGIMNSLMGIIKYLADPETQLASIVYWQMGSLTKVLMSDLFYITPVIVLGLIAILSVRWRINILSLGDNEAKSLGIQTKLLRGFVILSSTLLTASAVCMCGTIGWVGLVIPHLGRMLVGPDNTKSIPISMLLGSSFMIIIDTLARVMTTMELPLSILTGLIGAPFYILILSRQRMRLS
ncbi:Vitamin B12 ABC transporter, permease component BtuC [Lachnospiraceae bacterium TWA4]|nr:Vitamin B12 ABC transporter, permease component BtuC [Lachnospiraceae bacterium TWA4]